MGELKIEKTLRIYGILFIILGIVTFIFTYKYVLPIGSIFLIFSGIYIMFFRKFQKVIDRLIKEKYSKRKIE